MIKERDKKKYKATSSLIGILTTGKFSLLVKPDEIELDFSKKIIILNIGTVSFQFNLDRINDIELIKHNYCYDMIIDAEFQYFTVRCISRKKAKKLSTLIRSYIWTSMIKK